MRINKPPASAIKIDLSDGVSLAEFQAAMGVTDRFLTKEEAELTDIQPVNGKWRGHLLDEAEAGAEMMTAEPGFFAGLPFAAAELTHDRKRLKALLAARRSLLASLERLDRAITFRKGRIAERTGQLRGLVSLRLADPTFKPVRRLTEIAEPMMAIGREASAAQQSAARATLRLKQEAARKGQEADHRDLENKVLKGERLTLSDVRPAETAPRKTGRKTRR